MNVNYIELSKVPPEHNVRAIRSLYFLLSAQEHSKV